MNIFTFFLQNFSKTFSKTPQIAPFFKVFSGEHAPRTPLANAWLRHAPCKYPYFSKKIEPPRNEILDTPLHNIDN